MMHAMKLNGWAMVALASMGATAVAGPEAAKVVVGGEAPNFTLVDVDGKEHSLKTYTDEGKVVVLEWFNPGCPFVQKHYSGEQQTMNTLAKEFKDDGVVWLRINSGAAGKEGAGAEANKKAAADWKIDAPVLLDETGKVGQMYGAKRTPEMFIIGTDGKIHYHGAIDDNNTAKLKGDEKNYVEAALKQILAGETVTMRETKAYGCAIKY